MSRYHTLDTRTGVIVRESNYITPYKQGKRLSRRSWLERQLSTERGRLLLACSVVFLVGLGF